MMIVNEITLTSLSGFSLNLFLYSKYGASYQFNVIAVCTSEDNVGAAIHLLNGECLQVRESRAEVLEIISRALKADND